MWAAPSWVQAALGVEPLGVEPGLQEGKGIAGAELSWERGEGLEGLVQGSCGTAPSCLSGRHSDFLEEERV